MLILGSEACVKTRSINVYPCVDLLHSVGWDCIAPQSLFLLGNPLRMPAPQPTAVWLKLTLLFRLLFSSTQTPLPHEYTSRKSRDTTGRGTQNCPADSTAAVPT